jgi:hypothetical protein
MRTLVSVLILGIFVACGGSDDGDGSTPIDAPAASIDAPSGGIDAPPATARRTIYLNRHGGNYTVGTNDSVANTQIFSSGPVTAPAYPFGDAEWNATRDCIAQIFAPFDVSVVDVDPGPVDHMEIVVTTLPSVFGLPSTNGGIAPGDPTCTLLERGLALTFASVYGPQDIRGVCESAAAMAGITYGLDFAMHCPDVMTFLGGCGDKAFRNVTAECGEYQPRACRCGGTTQNAYQVLATRLGLHQ